MAKLSEQIKKANVANILKKVKSNKIVTSSELAAIEEYEQQQESEKIADSDFIVNLDNAADFFGVTIRCIQKWAKEGGMPKEAKGVYNLKKCFEWWKDNINVGVETSEEKEVRFRYWKAKAEAEEIKIERIKGELIRKENVYGEFAKRCMDLKTTLRAFKYRLSSLLEGKGREEIMQILGSEVDEMLRGFCRNGSFQIEKTKKRKKAK